MYPACRARGATTGVVACRMRWPVQRLVIVTWASGGSEVIVIGSGLLCRMVAQPTKPRLPTTTQTNRQREKRCIGLLLSGHEGTGATRVVCHYDRRLSVPRHGLWSCGYQHDFQGQLIGQDARHL